MWLQDRAEIVVDGAITYRGDDREYTTRFRIDMSAVENAAGLAYRWTWQNTDAD
jgi:hypothetical protein